jgi:C4-dicarboxylate transporter DctQ subunit
MYFLHKATRFFDFTTIAVTRVLGLAFILAVCLNFANVLGRYFIGHVMLGADEVQSFILVVVTVMGAAIVTWRGSHITMSIILELMPPQAGKVVRITADLTLAIVACLVAWQSWKIAAAMFDMGRVSDAAAVPMWIIHGLVLISFVSIAIFAIFRALGCSHQEPPSRSDDEGGAP